MQLGDQPLRQFMDDGREAVLLRRQACLPAHPRQHYLAQHVADQRHVQLRLHPRLALGEPVPQVQGVLEVAEKDFDPPSQALDFL